MGTPLIRLALFLHPGYRVVGSQFDEFKALCMQVNVTCHWSTHQPSIVIVFSCAQGAELTVSHVTPFASH